MSKQDDRQLPGEVARHRDRILELAAERGATNVRVFGSLLHGRADEESDIGILVDLKTRGFLREDILDRVEDEAIRL